MKQKYIIAKGNIKLIITHYISRSVFSFLRNVFKLEPLCSNSWCSSDAFREAAVSSLGEVTGKITESFRGFSSFLHVNFVTVPQN